MPTFRLICIGDSLVKGADTVPGGGRTFRGALQTRLAAGNFLSNFIGRVADAPASGGSDPDHEGYAGAFISSAGGSPNITGQITAMAAANPAVEGVLVLVGWADVLANTASIGTLYGTMVTDIQTAWSGVAVFICTLPPYYNLTEGATGSAYPAYTTLNTAIRALAGTNKYVVDLAALAGGAATERTAFLERILSETKRESDSLVAVNGLGYSDEYAGNRYASNAAVQAIMSISNPPGTGLPSAPGSDYHNDPNVLGRDYFPGAVSQIQTWTHAYLGPAHTATNTGVEIRNVCAMVISNDFTWGEMFAGARTAGNYWNGRALLNYEVPPGSVFRLQPDGITTFWRAASGTAHSIEGWQIDRFPSAGPPLQTAPYRGVNRALMANAAGYLVAMQARLALDDPNGPNDISRAQYLMRIGCDFQTCAPDGNRYGPGGVWRPRYDAFGFPLTAMDVGGGRNAFLQSTEWTTFGWVSIRETAFQAGLERPWYPPGNWTPSPYIRSPYGLTEAQIRANPPPLPSFWTYTTAGSGFAQTDYAGTTFLLAQSGADRVSQTIYDVMVASGELAGFVDTGGETAAPAPGISTRPVYADQQTGGLWTYEDTESGAAASAPVWQTTEIPDAIVSAAYSTGVSALGVPAPTYTKVSGPAWLTVNSTTGALTGTADATPAAVAVVLRATNSAGVADVSLTLLLREGLSITTSALPVFVVNVPYALQVQTAGAQPIEFSATGLPAGVAMSASGVISGTPTTASSGSVVVTSTNPDNTATRTISWQAAAAASLPVITTSSLPSGTVGTVYLAEIAATGTQPITYGAAGVPAGLALLYHKSNVVPNSDFSQGTTGWNKVTGSETLAVVDGALRVAGAGGGAFAGAHRSIATEPGTVYRLRITIKATNRQLVVGLRSPILWPITSQNNLFPAAPGTYELTHVAEAATMTVFVHQADSALSVQFDVDDIEVAPMTRNVIANAAMIGAVAAKSNLLLSSEEIDNASVWAGVNRSVVPNATTSPTGTLTADTLVPNNGASISTVTQDIDCTASTSYTASVYVKSAGMASANIRFITRQTKGGVFIGDARVTLTFADGTYTSPAGEGTPPTGVSVVVQSVGNGWYRVAISAVTNSNALGLRLDVRNVSVGDGTNGIYVWGAQITQSAYLLPYAPTTATAENSPSVMPPEWEVGPTYEGLAISIVGVGEGTIPGVPYPLRYMDIRAQGTTAATYAFLVGSMNAALPAVAGQTWTLGAYVQNIAGTRPGTRLALRLLQMNSSFAYFNAVDSSLTTSALSLTSITGTLPAGAAYVAGQMFVDGFAPGQVVDFTTRLYMPQLVQESSLGALMDPRYAYISGTPTAPGFYVLAATATNSLDTDDAALSLTINQSPAVSAAQSGGWGKFIRQ
jgi:hypothetical protein